MCSQTRNFKLALFVFLISVGSFVARAQEQGLKIMSPDLKIIENRGGRVDADEVYRIFFEKMDGYFYKRESEEELKARLKAYYEHCDSNEPILFDRVDFIGRFNFLEGKIEFNLDSLRNNFSISSAITKRTGNLEKNLTKLARKVQDDIREFYQGKPPGARSTIFVSSADNRVHSVEGSQIQQNKVNELSLLRDTSYNYLNAITKDDKKVRLSISSGMKESPRYRYWRIQETGHILEAQRWRGGVGFSVAPKGKAASFATEGFLERFLSPIFFLRIGGQYHNFGIEQSLRPIPDDPAESYVQRDRTLELFLGSGGDLFFDDGQISLSFTADYLIFNKGVRGLCHLRLNKFLPRFALFSGWQSLETIERRVFQPNGGKPNMANGKIRVESFVGGISYFSMF